MSAAGQEKRRMAVALLILSLVLLSGCAITPLIGDPVDLWRQPQTYWQKTTEGIDVGFRVIPQVPIKAEEARLEVTVRDLRAAASQSLLNAAIKGVASMPDRPQYAQALEFAELHRENGPGRYGAPIRLEMGGRWMADVVIQSIDGKRWKLQFPFLVSELK